MPILGEIIPGAVYEVPGSLKTERTRSGSVGYRNFLARYDYVDDATWKPVLNTTAYTYGLGWSASWRDSLVAAKINETPWDTTAPVQGVDFGHYSWYKVDVEYRIRSYSTAVWTVGRRVSANMLNLGQGRTWTTTQAPADVPISVPIVGCEYTFSRLFANGVADEAAIRGNLYKVNGATFMISEGTGLRTHTFDAGTLLFQNYNIEKYNDSYEEVSYSFKWLPQSHNLFWNSATASWDTLTPAVFGTTSFNAMMGLA